MRAIDGEYLKLLGRITPDVNGNFTGVTVTAAAQGIEQINQPSLPDGKVGDGSGDDPLRPHGPERPEQKPDDRHARRGGCQPPEQDRCPFEQTASFGSPVKCRRLTVVVLGT